MSDRITVWSDASGNQAIERNDVDFFIAAGWVKREYVPASALIELAADLQAEHEKEVAELKATNFALMKLYDAIPHAASCKYIPPILRSELQDASGLYECDCWKLGSLDTAILDEVKRVLTYAIKGLERFHSDVLSWKDVNVIVHDPAPNHLHIHQALNQLLTRLGGASNE